MHWSVPAHLLRCVSCKVLDAIGDLEVLERTIARAVTATTWDDLLAGDAAR